MSDHPSNTSAVVERVSDGTRLVGFHLAHAALHLQHRHAAVQSQANLAARKWMHPVVALRTADTTKGHSLNVKEFI
jgi:hypothetical protein